MLKDFKCLVQDFSDPIEALHSLKMQIDNIPDIIITDYEMPHINGIELIREIRKIAFLKEVPTLILTGRNISKILLEAIDAGADAFAGACRMMDRVLQPADQAGAVQEVAMSRILNDVVADAHCEQADDESP